MPANSTAATPARRRGRPARFAACQAIQGYVKLEAIQGVPARNLPTPTPVRNAAFLPANCRTVAQIAEWARSQVAAQLAEEARRNNPDNNKVRLATGADIELGSLRKFVARINELGLNAFFKLDKVTDRVPGARRGHYENCEISYVVDVILCPATATPDWRRLPAAVQNTFEAVSFCDGKLTNGTEYVKFYFGD